MGNAVSIVHPRLERFMKSNETTWIRTSPAVKDSSPKRSGESSSDFPPTNSTCFFTRSDARTQRKIDRNGTSSTDEDDLGEVVGQNVMITVQHKNRVEEVTEVSTSGMKDRPMGGRSPTVTNEINEVVQIVNTPNRRKQLSPASRNSEAHFSGSDASLNSLRRSDFSPETLRRATRSSLAQLHLDCSPPRTSRYGSGLKHSPPTLDLSAKRQEDEGASDFRLDVARLRRSLSVLYDGASTSRFVSYVPQVYPEFSGDVAYWWLPSEFCQSRLGDRQIGSNACTLIVVILAHRIHVQDIHIYGPCPKNRPLSGVLISAIAESIIDGNEIHELMMRDGQLRDINLTLPEAMKACGQRIASTAEEWSSSVHVASLTDSLFDYLHKGIMKWEISRQYLAPNSHLYIVLITDGRSVLLVYQRDLDQVTLIDSHGHHTHGAIVALVPISELSQLCAWYDDLCLSFFGCNPKCYEISFIFFTECNWNPKNRYFIEAHNDSDSDITAGAENADEQPSTSRGGEA